MNAIQTYKLFRCDECCELLTQQIVSSNMPVEKRGGVGLKERKRDGNDVMGNVS